MGNIKFEDFICKMQRLIDEARKQNAFHEFVESNDKNKPKGGIVKECFNEGNGSYKVNLAYLNEEQVKEIEGLVKKWNPELKEIDDEKIRKALIRTFNELKTNQHVNGVLVEDILTWLEKQSEPNPYSGVSFKYNGHTWGMCARDNGVDILLDKQFFKHLEKQGEQKQDPCDNCKDVMLNCHNFPCIKKRAFKQGKSVLEAIIDEKVDNANKVEPKDYSSIDPHFGKPVDKVKPKFKQGQWIVWKDKCYKVNYNGCGYELIDQNGLSTSLEYGTVDTSARLWDVTKDAKAGDVLVIQETDFTYESIFIFNKIENNHIIQYLHYFITDTDEEVCKVKSVGGFIGDVGDNVHPATKEQREQLKKAMTDAGYAFNFDKKELKKIEDEIEIPFGAKDSELQEATYYIPKGFHAEIDEDKVAIKKGELNIRKLESLVKQIWATAEHENDKDTIHKMSNLSFFLKTLKPQLKQEWSEEDENLLKLSFENLTELKDRYGEEYGKVGDCISWLKSLKGRVGCEVNCTTTKKWSEEDIATISRVISIVKWAAYSDHSHPILNDEGATELVERLKSLKQRYTWKPSDEQIEALEHFVRSVGESGYASPYDNNTKLLYSILSDLKKLKED